ncbi:lumenal Hsp70 protein [Elasticomyces elasticus]|nr:lumenal Hsp70 protein [Elasticomyces elasticus]
MPPPGRRRGAAVSPSTMLLGLFLLFASSASAAGSVLGLDFGTLNLKAALVKPGIPLEIVLSKDSKRKETAALAFKPNRDSKNQILAEPGTFPERVYGGDALALQGRIPGEVFPNLKLLLGLPADGTSDMISTYNSRYPAVRVEQVEELGTVMIKSSAFVKEEPSWSVQELLAMELANVKRNAEALAGKGSSVDDAVITIPAFYTADERRAIENAAGLAGLNVNAIITDGLAVGLDYAKSRTFPEVTKGEKPEYHIVYDMGAGSTTATLLRFQGKSVKDIGRYNKTVQEVAVLGTGWDRTLGGRSQRLRAQVPHEACAEEPGHSGGRDQGRWPPDVEAVKDAEKARQVLSANTETTSSFEELMPEIDFRVKLTRADFEALTIDFAERVEGPIKDALAAAKLTMKDIDSIIMFGGAVRTPFVQKKLEKVAGGSAKLRSNVNADESAVFGAAFKAAGLSPSFKVKEIRDSDVAGYAAGMMYQDGGKERKQPIFGITSRVGSGAATKQVSFKDKEDFAFSVYQTVDGVDRTVIRVQTNNLTAGVKELNTKYGCTAADVSTKFGIKLSAVNRLPEVVSGTVSCEVEGSAKSGSVMDTAKDWLGLGKKDQEPLGGEDDGPTEEVKAGTSSASKSKSSSTSSSGSSSSSSSKVPEKPKKRTESINVAFVVTPQGNPQPAPEELKRMRDRLAAFDKSDHARLAREEALNVLESYTYQVRDFLSNSDYSLVGTDAMRDEISKLLDTTRSFMESPSDVAKATEQVLREKLSGLKKLVEPVKSRRSEETARPEKVAALRENLDQTGKFVEMVREQVDKAATASSKASVIEASKSAEAAAKSAAAPAESSAASDGFDDLEEPDTSSTSTSDAPKYSNPADFSPYSSVDLADLESVYEKVGTWLSEKEAEQGKLKSHEDPVLLVKDIETQASKLSQVMRDLLSKKMRQQQQQSKTTSSSKKPASAKSSKTKSSKKSAKSSATSTDGAEESASGTKSAKPAFVTINPGDDMPTEEEIMRMVNEAKDQGAETKAAKSKHDEL